MRIKMTALCCTIVVATALRVMCQTVPQGAFRVGAAKVDITPAQSELAKGYLGILDQVYSRAIVIDNGHTSAALVSLDAGAAPGDLCKAVSERIEKELGIPAVNILITATHSHSVPGVFPMFARPGASMDSAAMSRVAAYEGRVFDSVKQAKDKLQPARVSYGTGVSYINVQRSGRIDVTKWFGRLILIGWSLLALFTIAGFSFPKLMHGLFGWFAPYLVLWPLSLILGTGVFVVMLIYRNSIERRNDLN